MTGKDLVIVMYGGKLFRIPKVPFETEEQAYTRAWYIAKHYGTLSFSHLQSLASQKMYEQYYGMKYDT